MLGVLGFFEFAGVYVGAGVGGGVAAGAEFTLGLDATGSEGLGHGGFGFREGLRGG